MSRSKERWQRWDKGVYVRESTVYLSYHVDGRRIKEPLGPVSSVKRTLACEACAVRLAEIVQGKFKIDQAKKISTLASLLPNLSRQIYETFYPKIEMIFKPQ